VRGGGNIPFARPWVFVKEWPFLHKILSKSGHPFITLFSRETEAYSRLKYQCFTYEGESGKTALRYSRVVGGSRGLGAWHRIKSRLADATFSFFILS
jgi:hypothetical protein